MRALLFALSVLMLAASCEPNRVFERQVAISGHEWAHTQVPEYQVEVPDTTSTYNLYISIRHHNDYPFSNLWFRLHTIYPSGKTGTLRQQVFLGDNEQHRWRGECLNEVCNVLLPVVEDLRLSEAGRYTFRIEHIMRTNPLPGIMDVGLRIEQNKPSITNQNST
jgi:gliding motility-associated lipoprotein GldH